MGYFDDLRVLGVFLDQRYSAPFDTRWPGIYSIQLLDRGTMRFGRDRVGVQVLHAPCVYWIDPRHTYQLAASGGDDRRHLVLFGGERGRRIIHEGFDAITDGGWCAVYNPQIIETHLRRLARLSSDPRTRPGELVHVVESLLIHASGDGRPPNGDRSSRLAIAECAETIHADPFAAFSAEDTASTLHMSYSHFRRLFRTEVGFSPYDYLLRCRLQRCAVLLADDSLSIKEIALQAGYDDPGYFARAFRRLFGVSPSEYRRYV